MFIESVFEYQQPIPAKYTGDGQNVSPPLKFGELPQGTKSLALILDDPDAPSGIFVHWVVWNISPNVLVISEGAPELNQAKQGKNSYDKTGYKGPNPPPGKPHRYFFKLYALDAPSLDLPEGSTKAQLEEAMKGHILDEAEFMGTYQRSK